MIYVTRPKLPPIEEYKKMIDEIWESRQLTNMGPMHKRFSEELKRYLRTEDIELFTNGHMALELTLQAFKLKGEVITTPFTFASTAHAIVRNGLTPVFADIKEDDYTLDPASIEAHITEKTAAIVPVHVYGNLADVEAIEKIAKKHNLKVIYDAAHAFGVTYKGKGVANFGDASIFSFHATKLYHSVEGGAASFKDKKIGERLYNLKNFGIQGPEIVEAVGANAKMHEFSAAMGILNLKYVEEEIEARRIITEKYEEILSNIQGLRVRSKQEGVVANYAYFPIFIDEDEFGVSRDIVAEELLKHNVAARKYFYPLTSSFDAYAGKFNPNDTPVALKLSKQVLALPLYGDLPLNDVERIATIVRRCKK